MELLALGGLAAVGYFWSTNRPITHRAQTIPKKPRMTEEDAVTKKFEAAKRPQQTGVFLNRHVVDEMPLPMFKSRTIAADPKVSYQKLELFTGNEGGAYGGISLRQPKTEKASLFSPVESRVPVTFSGSGGGVYSDFDRSRYVASQLHQNVSCTEQMRDVPALKEDPTFSWTPMMPHHKPGSHPLPEPGDAPGGAKVVPVVPQNTAELTKTKVRIPHTYDTVAGANPHSAYAHLHSNNDTEMITGSLARKPQGIEYFGIADSYNNGELYAPPFQATRTTDRAIAPNYVGPGTRQFNPGGERMPLPLGDARKQVVAPLAIGHAAATSVLSSTETPQGFQERTKPNGEIPGAPVREGAVFGFTHAVPTDTARGKANGVLELPNNEYTRTTMTSERTVTSMYAKERDRHDAFNQGAPGAAAIPLATLDETFVKNAELNDRVLVTDPQVHATLAKEALDIGTVEAKQNEVVFDSTVLQPVHIGNPDRLKSGYEIGQKAPEENVYLPPAMI